MGAFVSGCLGYAWTGQTVHARVAIVVDEDLFEKVRNGDEGELKSNPYRSQSILNGIKSGVTVQDVREGRFVFCHCLSSDSVWRTVPWFDVLLPKNSNVKIGDDVELIAGTTSVQGENVSLSRFVRRLPDQGKLIPYCTPSDN